MLVYCRSSCDRPQQIGRSLMAGVVFSKRASLKKLFINSIASMQNVTLRFVASQHVLYKDGN